MIERLLSIGREINWLTKKDKECSHSWKYNFPSLPSRRICVNCKRKELLNLINLEWEEGQRPDRRSDEQIIKSWF